MRTVPKDVYHRAAQICKSYPALLERLKQIDSEIIHASPAGDSGMPRGTAPGDTTASKALRLIAIKEELERKLAAINGALCGLRDDAEIYVIQKNLFERVPMEHINTFISVRTIKRIRREFIITVAENLHEV